jgi:hypothetical protein
MIILYILEVQIRLQNLKLSKRQIQEVNHIINFLMADQIYFHSCEVIPDDTIKNENYGVFLIVFYKSGIRIEVRVYQTAAFTVKHFEN